MKKLNTASIVLLWFWKLRARVFDNHDLNLSTKTSVYRSVIIPALTYSCETWVPYKRHIRALERIQQRQLRQIMHIKWFHKVFIAQVLQKAEYVHIISF